MYFNQINRIKKNVLALKTAFVLLALVWASATLMAAPAKEKASVQSTQAAPAQTAVSAQPAQPVQIADMRGRLVTLPASINKIIALEANSLRLLSYFDAVKKVVAVEDVGHGREKTTHQFFNQATYRLAHPFLRDLPSIGDSKNHEGIIAAAPDLIFCSTADVSKLDQLQQTLGIPVFGINADVELNDLPLFLDQIKIVGTVLGEEKRAEQLVAGINAILQDVSSRAKRVQQPASAYAGGMMYYGPANLLRTTGDFIPFDFTGTKNVMPTNPAKNRQPYMTSMEALIVANPDFVFIDAANAALSKSEYLANKKIFDEQVSAFKKQQVYTTLVYKYYGTNWDNQVVNIYLVGKTLYPELYADVDLAKKAVEIWQLFFGVSLDYNNVLKLQGTEQGRVSWF